MTTIAYRDGVLAADSWITANGIVRGETTKLMQLADGSLLGTTGFCGLDRHFAAWIDAGEKWEDRPRFQDDAEFYAILVRPDGRVFACAKNLYLVPVEGEFITQGSGNEIALGALSMGASAAQAVEVASRFDVYTGGRITTLTLGAPAQKPGEA